MKNTYAVASISVKGGTGKSLSAINLAYQLAKKYKVCLLDADVDSPNIPSMLGVKGKMKQDDDKRFIPTKWTDGKVSFGIVSAGLFKSNGPITFFKRGEENRQIISDLVNNTDWGDMEVLVIDLPAGSGDEMRAALGAVKRRLLGVSLVTLPVTADDCTRVINLCSMNRIRIFGIMENMKGAVTKDGKKVVIEGEGREFYPLGDANTMEIQKISKERGIEYLGRIPFVEGMYSQILLGKPIIPEHSNGTIVKTVNIIENMIAECEKEGSK